MEGPPLTEDGSLSRGGLRGTESGMHSGQEPPLEDMGHSTWATRGLEPVRGAVGILGVHSQDAGGRALGPQLYL